MINKPLLLKEIRSAQEFFERSSCVLNEEDSSYSPAPGMMTVAQQVAHVAMSIHWLIDGATSSEGFDMNFEEHTRLLKSKTSLSAARKDVAEAFQRAISIIEKEPEEFFAAPIAPGPIMGGEPRAGAFLGIIEHTAHHRGALTTYSRLRGKEPSMPYLETQGLDRRDS